MGKPARIASVGFHLMHLAGILDRLFTYAKRQALSNEQLKVLSAEGSEPFPGCTAEDLATLFSTQVDKALAQLPSTTLGLLFHAAEHTQRHVGKLLVTARIVRNMY